MKWHTRSKKEFQVQQIKRANLIASNSMLLNYDPQRCHKKGGGGVRAHGLNDFMDFL